MADGGLLKELAQPVDPQKQFGLGLSVRPFEGLAVSWCFRCGRRAFNGSIQEADGQCGCACTGCIQAAWALTDLAGFLHIYSSWFPTMVCWVQGNRSSTTDLNIDFSGGVIWVSPGSAVSTGMLTSASTVTFKDVSNGKPVKASPSGPTADSRIPMLSMQIRIRSVSLRGAPRISNW